MTFLGIGFLSLRPAGGAVGLGFHLELWNLHFEELNHMLEEQGALVTVIKPF